MNHFLNADLFFFQINDIHQYAAKIMCFLLSRIYCFHLEQRDESYCQVCVQ